MKKTLSDTVLVMKLKQNPDVSSSLVWDKSEDSSFIPDLRVKSNCGLSSSLSNLSSPFGSSRSEAELSLVPLEFLQDKSPERVLKTNFVKLDYSSVVDTVSDAFVTEVSDEESCSDSEQQYSSSTLECIESSGDKQHCSTTAMTMTMTSGKIDNRGDSSDTTVTECPRSCPVGLDNRSFVAGSCPSGLDSFPEGVASGCPPAVGGHYRKPGRTSSMTMPTTTTTAPMKSVTMPRRFSHQRSRSDVTHFVTNDCRLPSTKSEYCLRSGVACQKGAGTCHQRRMSFLEDGGSCVVRPITECFFPRPTEGQSLTSFLSSQDFHTCAELDKENNHFSISEALIAAIEQIKWNEMMKRRSNTTDNDDDDDSDEEIQRLQERIRIRRSLRQQEKASTKKSLVLLSDGRTDTTTSQSASPVSSHSSTDYSGDSSSDSVSELVISGDESESTSQLVAIRDNGLSLSMASLYSDADIHRGIGGSVDCRFSSTLRDESKTPIDNNAYYGPDSLTPSHSAESVALSLLKKFSEKQLPKASDLEWLVSEKDAPQTMRLRGNLEWAPPRAQIIFSIHPVPQRKVVMAKQNYRCAGCGMKIEVGYIKRFRYCDYLGKYFCQICHTNSSTYIPGRVLRKWDFNKYYVSNFSHDLLENMFFDPLFNVTDINAGLYRKAKLLNQAREYRQQLYYLKDFVQTCRNTDRLKNEYSTFSPHIYNDVHLYSLNDLVQAKQSNFCNRLKTLVNQSIAHVVQCQLCQAKGFICEICRKDEVIFPFHLQKIVQCSKCYGCFHRQCFANSVCPKCKRIQTRKKKVVQNVNSDLED